jgi:hypothetical protein
VRVALVLTLGTAIVVGCGRVPLDLSATGSAGTGANAGKGGSAGAAGNSGGTNGAAGNGAAGAAGLAPCDGILDETTCKARPDCRAQECMTCGSPAFTCYGSDETPPACMIAPCPPTSGCLGTDAMTCAAQPGCTPVTCDDCKGGKFFAGCADPGERIGCAPCPTPPACSSLDVVACGARSDCHPGYCPNCMGGQTFQGCLGPNEAVACEDGCPAPACGTLGEMACDVRADCHSVFADQGICGCKSVGCCIGFARCADGAKAACNGPTGSAGVLCTVAPPGCGGAFVTSYTATCYEGCVQPTECGP